MNLCALPFGPDRSRYHEMSSISLKNISKTFPDGTQALRNLNLEIKPGEFIVLVGPSGCGKTTLLRIVAGLESPSEGSVYIQEKEATALHPKDRDLALVFQNYALFPNLSVLDNLAFGLRARKLPKMIIREKVLPVAQRLGLKDLIKRKPSELSGGQRQRVALGRLLARNPSIHLLDEPLSNLDANLRTSMRQELAQIHAEHQKTTLFVTHDQVEAMTLGQRLCVMNRGQIIQVGNPSEIYDFPSNRFVAEFFGSPTINLIRGEIQRDNKLSFFGSGSIRLSLPDDIELPDGPVELGLRPEDWTIVNEEKTLSLEGVLERTENLGDSRILHFSTEFGRLTAKSDQRDFQTARTYFLIPNWNRVHWFDISSGKRISG